MGEYIDVRDIHPDFKSDVCYRCGGDQYFKQIDDWDGSEEWLCQQCKRRHRLWIEIPCSECESPLRQLSRGTKCTVCGHENQLDKGAIIDRLTSGDYAVKGMPGVLMGECPFCGESMSVNGGPDGELYCSENESSCFYAGQYSDEWFGYGLWLLNQDRVDIRE